jgi:hypothetical protein
LTFAGDLCISLPDNHYFGGRWLRIARQDLLTSPRPSSDSQKGDLLSIHINIIKRFESAVANHYLLINAYWLKE